MIEHHLLEARDVTLGTGYQRPLRQDMLNISVKSETKDPAPAKIYQCKMQMHCVDKINEIETAVNTALTATTPGTVAVPSIKAELKSTFEKKHKDSHVYIVVVVDQESKTEKILSPVLSETAAKHLGENNAEGFYNENGDSFISRVRRGKKLVAILQVELDENQNKMSFKETLGAKAPIAEASESVEIMRSRLNSVKISDKKVYSLGGKTSWKFTDVDGLLKEVDEHIKAEVDDVIGFETRPYTAVNDVAKYKDKLIKVEKIAELISNLLATAEHLENKLSKINIPVDKNSARFGSLEIMKGDGFDQKRAQLNHQLKQDLLKLKAIKEGINSRGRKLESNVYQRYEVELAEIKSRYDQPQYKTDLKEARHKALIRHINCSAGNKKEQQFSIKMDMETQKQVPFIFLQFENAANIRYTLKYKPGRFNLRHKAFEEIQLSGKGAYIPVEAVNLGELIVTFNEPLPANTWLNIYGCSKIPKSNISQIAHLNNKARKELKLDGMAGDEDDLFTQAELANESNTAEDEEDFSSDANVSSGSYLNYASTSKPSAHKLAKMGLNAAPVEKCAPDRVTKTVDRSSQQGNDRMLKKV